MATPSMKAGESPLDLGEFQGPNATYPLAGDLVLDMASSAVNRAFGWGSWDTDDPTLIAR